MYCDPADFVFHYFTFSSVQTRPYSNFKALDSVPDSTSTANTTCRSVKGGKKSITCRIDLFTSKAIQFSTDETVVTFKEITPPTPSSAARLDESTMSVKRTVAKTHSVSIGRHSPVKNCASRRESDLNSRQRTADDQPRIVPRTLHWESVRQATDLLQHLLSHHLFYE